MNTTSAIILGAALGSLLLVSVHLAVWFKERERALLLGAVAWMANLARFVAEDLLLSAPEAAVLQMVVELALVINGVFILAAGYAVRRESLPRGWIWGSGVMIFWILFDAMGIYPELAFSLPVHLFACALLIRAGTVIATERSQGGRAAWFLAGTLFVWALVIVARPWIPSPSRLQDAQYLLQIILGVVFLVCALLFILEGWRREFARTAEQLRLSIDQAADGVLIADASGRLIDANLQICRMMRCCHEQLIGRTINETLGPSEAAIDAAYLEEMQAGKVIRRERTLRRFDDTSLEVEVNAAALSDGRLQAMIRDVSERKHAERALEASEERFRTLMANIPIGVALWDRDYRYLYINPVLADFNKLPVPRHTGNTVREVHPEAADWLEDILKKVLTTGEPVVDFEFVAQDVQPGGVARRWNTTFFPVYGSGHSITGVGCCTVEVSP